MHAWIVISMTWTSREQSRGYRTKMRGEWLRCCGRWCQRQRRDPEGKGMILLWFYCIEWMMRWSWMYSRAVSVEWRLQQYTVPALTSTGVSRPTPPGNTKKLIDRLIAGVRTWVNVMRESADARCFGAAPRTKPRYSPSQTDGRTDSQQIERTYRIHMPGLFSTAVRLTHLYAWCPGSAGVSRSAPFYATWCCRLVCCHTVRINRLLM